MLWTRFSFRRSLYFGALSFSFSSPSVPVAEKQPYCVRLLQAHFAFGMVVCRWWAELVSFKHDSQNWFSSDQRILFLYPSSDLCLKYNPVSAVCRHFLELHGLVCALICIVNCGTLYRQVCAFPNHVQSTEFTTGGLQSSYRNISRMISGNRMHLSSILSVMAKAANTYVHVNFLSCFFLSLLFLNTNNSNKRLSHCHYGVLFVELWGK